MVIRNGPFIQDTDVKIDRADKRARSELELVRKADEEILQLKNAILDSQISKDEEMQDILRNLQYKKFLEET